MTAAGKAVPNVPSSGTAHRRVAANTSRSGDRIALVAFIEALVSRGIRPTRGLVMYRQAGGAIRTERWFQEYRRVRTARHRAAIFARLWPLRAEALTALRGILFVIASSTLRSAVAVRRVWRKIGSAVVPPSVPGQSISRGTALAGESFRAIAIHAPRLYRGLERRIVRLPINVVLVPCAAFALLLLFVHTISFLYLLYVGLTLVLAGVCSTTLVWMLYAWRDPISFEETGLTAEVIEPRLSFSLIVPARHEEAVLETTLSRLVAADHPVFEVIVVVGDDDPGTRAVAERVARAHPHLIRAVTDHNWPKNKPRALNTALPHCRGEITGVFDAEDDVNPSLLRSVDRCFEATGADVVQAGVQLMNFHSSWFAVRNVLEYYFWFRSRLHYHAHRRFIPLGGNTVFVRTELLRQVEGWDPDCLAEDCELGVRLSSLGGRTAVFYEPDLVTREETPSTLRAFARQRTRWNQGYLETLSRRYWRRLPLGQQALALYTLAMPYLMALAWLMIPTAIGTMIFLRAPLPITLISFVPLLPMLAVLAVETAGLADFCRLYGRRASVRDYLRLVLGLPLYQSVLAFAAARAVAREARGARGWEKTAHYGLHLAHEDGQSAISAKEPETVVASRAVERETPGPSLGRPVPLAATEARPAKRSTHALRAASVDATSGQGAGGADGNGFFHLGVLRPRPDVVDAVRVSSPLRPLVAVDPLTQPEPPGGRMNVASPDGAPTAPVVAAFGQQVGSGWIGRLCVFVVRIGKSHADAAIQLPLLAAIGLVIGTNIAHWPGVQFDEGTYIGNAWAVQHRGALAFYTYTYGHPPLAWLVVTLWTWASGIFGRGTYSIDAGRELMLVINIVSCWLVYTLARRLGMARPFAVAAVILFALSPIGVFFHRGVFLDNPATAWALAAFVLALTPRRRLWAFAGSGACFAASVLSKETTLVLFPALLLAAAQNADPRTRRYCLTLFVSFLGLISLAYPLYATLKGELLPGRGHVSLIRTAIDMVFLRRQSGSIFDPHSVAHGTVQFWLQLDPWLLGAALVFCPIALIRRGTRPVAFAFLIQVVMLLRPGYLPNMYVIAFLPFAALVVAASLESMCRSMIAVLRRNQLTTVQHKSGRSGSRAPVFLRGTVVVASALLFVASAAAAVHLTPGWLHADRIAMRGRPDAPTRAAQRWLIHNVGHEQRLIVTDDFWIYLIEHGFDSHPVRGGFNSRTVVSYWPLDYDPAVKRYFPRGWRDFDYVVSTDAMRVTAVYTPTTAQALHHSRLVAQFGRGPLVIEIRKIIREAPGPSPPIRSWQR